MYTYVQYVCVCVCLKERERTYRELQVERLPVVAQRERRLFLSGRRRESWNGAEEELVAHIAMSSGGMLNRVEQQVVRAYSTICRFDLIGTYKLNFIHVQYSIN